MTTMIDSAIKPKVWHGLDDEHGYQCQGEIMNASVERSDDDEVAIHGMLPQSDTADVTLYVTRGEALALAHLLIVAAVRPDA